MQVRDLQLENHFLHLRPFLVSCRFPSPSLLECVSMFSCGQMEFSLSFYDEMFCMASASDPKLHHCHFREHFFQLCCLCYIRLFFLSKKKKKNIVNVSLKVYRLYLYDLFCTNSNCLISNAIFFMTPMMAGVVYLCQKKSLRYLQI